MTLDVHANDTAPDGTLNRASIVITTSPKHGTATVNAGKVLYTPTVGFAGTDSFAYTVSDDQGIVSAPASVTISVTALTVTAPAAGGGSTTWLTLCVLAGLWCLRLSGARATTRG